jgi:hypothetical protein
MNISVFAYLSLIPKVSQYQYFLSAVNNLKDRVCVTTQFLEHMWNSILNFHSQAKIEENQCESDIYKALCQ